MPTPHPYLYMRSDLNISSEFNHSMTNRSSHQAELTIFGRTIDWEEESALGTLRFGVEYAFPPIDTETLDELINEGYLDKDDAHNSSPTVGTFLSWGQEIRKEFEITPLFSGFMVAPSRPDSRITINGTILESSSPLPQSAIDQTLSRFSPDLIEAEDSRLHLWWD